MAASPGEGPQKNRKIILSLSFTSIFTFFLVVIAAMTAAYVWGVMTGRNHVVLTENNTSSVEKGESGGETETDILQAHELEFTHVLRGEAPRPKAPERKEQPAAAKEAPVAPEPAVQASEPAPALPPAPIEPARSPEKPAHPDGEVNDYVFQVAALKDEQAMDNLREKLEGRGLRTRMERSGKLFMVMVLMRGDNSRVSELEQIARELRLGTPLLRSKKASGQ